MVRLEAIQLFGPHSILHQPANIVTTRGALFEWRKAVTHIADAISSAGSNRSVA